MSAVSGWLAIVLALLALAPSMVPGAMSLIGLAAALLAMMLSLFSIRRCGKKYFTVTAIIVLGGVLLVNDGLRIWFPLPMPLSVWLTLYAIVVVVFAACALLARRLMPRTGPVPPSSAGCSF